MQKKNKSINEDLLSRLEYLIEKDKNDDLKTYLPYVLRKVNKIRSFVDIYDNKNDSSFTYVTLLILFIYYRYPNKDKVTDQGSFISYIFNDSSVLQTLPISSQQFIKVILNESLPEEDFYIICHLLSTIDNDKFEEYFPEIFDYVLRDYYNSKAKHGGYDISPTVISQLITGLANVSKNASIYNPFAGLASFGVSFPRSINYFGQEINESNASLGNLRLLAHYKAEYKELVQGDSINNWNPKGEKYDLVVTNPPFGLKGITNDDNQKITIEQFIIENGLKALKKKGKLITTVSLNFLNTEMIRVKKLRKYLIDNDLIETVISMPSGLLKHTAISFAILVINKNKTHKNKVKLVDATFFTEMSENKYSKVLDYKAILDVVTNGYLPKIINTAFGEVDESPAHTIISNSIIKETKYSLNIARYFLPEIDGVKLSMFLDKMSFTRENRLNDDSKGKYISIKDLSNDPINYGLEIKNLNEVHSKIKNAYKLTKDCLLIAKVGNKLKPTYYKHNNKSVFFINPNIVAFIVDINQVDLDYLIMELNSDYVEEQVFAFNTGAAIQHITARDLLDIKIELPSIELQKQKVKKQQYRIWSEQMNLVKETKAKYGIDIADENSFLRHKIAGRLKNIRGSFNRLNTIIEEQLKDMVPNLEELQAHPKLKNTFSDYLEIIKRDLEIITQEVRKSGSDIEIKTSKIGDINIVDFISKYVNEIKNDQNKIFDLSINVDQTLLDENKVKSVIIRGDEKLLNQMFDNIIENAVKHGFRNKMSVKNKIDILFMYDFDDNEVQINFSNTGETLPEDYSHDAFIRKGSKTGENAGNGIGGWLINEIMKKHNGKFGFTDETGVEGVVGEFVTSIELTFPISINYKK